MADAQALTIFAQAIAQAASQLVNNSNPDSPDYAKLKAYFNENVPKLKIVLDRLESDLGND